MSTPLESAAVAVICSIWFSRVWLNWLFPYVIGVGVVTMMEVGCIVPLPKLLAIDGESLIALEVWNKL